jgi:hypothetical protein
VQGRVISVALVAACAVAALPAWGDAQSDFDQVYGDWKADHVITQCHWTEPQLQNAYDVANGNPDFQYETGFQDDVRTELNRWKSGGCAGVTPTTVTKKSPLTGAHITAVKGKGSARREIVKIRNHSKLTLAFRKASLRGGKKSKAVFPAKFKLKTKKVAVVHIGCAKGKKRASFKGTTVWLCRRKQLFRDRGDVVKLADAKGVVVSQRGFGTKKKTPSF